MHNPLAPLATISVPDQARLAAGAKSTLQMVSDYEIIDQDGYALAADELKSIKAMANTLEERRTAITGPINTALKAVNDLFRGPAVTLQAAEKIIKDKMSAYTREEERKAAEAARKAREEAEARAADIASTLPTSDAAREAVAEVLTQSAAMPVAQPAKVAGISQRKTTAIEVTDKAAFLAHVAANPHMLDLVDVNSSKVTSLAKALGPAMNIPGIKVVEHTVLSARA